MTSMTGSKPSDKYAVVGLVFFACHAPVKSAGLWATALDAVKTMALTTQRTIDFILDSHLPTTTASASTINRVCAIPFGSIVNCSTCR